MNVKVGYKLSKLWYQQFFNKKSNSTKLVREILLNSVGEMKRIRVLKEGLLS